MSTLNRIGQCTTLLALFTAVEALPQAAPPPLPPLPPPPPPAVVRSVPTPTFFKPMAAPVPPLPPAPQAAPYVTPITPVPLVQPKPAPVVQQIATTPPPPPPPLQPATYLAWDAESKEQNPKPGDVNAHFTFWLTNVSSSEVLINSVRTSCGCTVAQLPSTPWRLAPGTNGPIEVNLDLRGKSGTIAKSVTVDSTTGIKNLTVKVNIPNPALAAGAQTNAPGVDLDRLKNMQLAMADRQVVFKGECAKCHADEGHGKMGLALYKADCAICHDSPHRASMVPDLRALKHPTDAAHWKNWITSGRVGSMMPAFGKAEGGPLTDEQIASLVEYLTKTIPGVGPPSASADPAKP